MSRAQRYDAVVIGAGHNGLVCAAYLARAGLRTLVLERGERVGGAAVTSQLADGFRVPTVAHTVGRLRTSVIRDLGLERHGLRLVQPGVRVFAPHPDGGSLTLWGDPARTAEEIQPWSRRDADAYPRFDRKVRVLASFVAHLHAATPPDLQEASAADAMTGVRLARAFRRLGPRPGRELLRALPMAVADFVGEGLEHDLLRAVIAARGIQHTAMAPWSAGTTAVLLGDSVGSDRGAAGQAAFAIGGPGAVTGALEAAARSFGAGVRTRAEVAAVILRGGRASGVTLTDGEEITARAVVSGADPKRTLLSLCDPEVLGPTLVWQGRNLRLAGTVAKVNLALDGLPPFPGGDPERLQGRIVAAGGIDQLERAFDASKYGGVSEDLYLEATIPSLVDPTLAPPGKHVMSVVAQYAPYRLRDGDWDAEREGLGDRVLKRLEAFAPGTADRVVAREVLTPLDLERDFGLTEGHPMHGEPGLDQFFAWRPLLGHARYRFGPEGLYLCGSGAHPGGGVTGAPGAKAARVVMADLKRR